MAKSVDHFGGELATIRTGRANPALIDKVMVPYYGTPTPLNQLAQISAPEPRLLVVQVYDRSQMASVEKAIRDAGQGLNPANDGQVVRMPIPPLTEERRREYVKMVRQRAEEARDSSGGLIDAVTDRQILAAYRMLAGKEAVFGELASAAGVAGLIQARENGQLDAGSRVVCTITGNGLKDPDWAVSAAPAPVTVQVDPAAASAALGLA